MKNLCYIQLLVLSIFTLFCCSNERLSEPANFQNNIQNKINIDFEEAVADKLSSIVSEVKYLELEESDQSLIGSIDDILFVDDQIFILDRTGEKILAFNISGKHLFNINKKGGGPEEYVNLIDFTYDHTSQSIVISTYSKILWYDLGGHFVKSMNTPYAGGHSLTVLPNSNLAIYMAYSPLGNSDSFANLYVISPTGQVIERFLPFDEGLRSDIMLHPHSVFAKRDTSILFFTQYSRNIFQLSSNALTALYEVDFGSHNLPTDFETEYLKNGGMSYEQVLKLRENNEWAHLTGVAPMLADNWLYFLVTFQPGYDMDHFVYNLKSGQLIQYNDKSTINDIGGNYVPTNYFTFQDYFVSVVYPSELKNALEKTSIHEIDIQNTIVNMEIGENPVLRLVKFKSNDEN